MQSLFLLVLGLALTQAPATSSVGVTDGAKLFSEATVASANESIAAIRRVSGWQLRVVTVETLAGKNIHDETIARAKAENIRGLVVLIAKKEGKLYAQPSDRARHAFTKEKVDEIIKTFTSDFAAKKFDQGLTDAVEEVRRLAVLSRATDEAVGVRDGAKMFSSESIAKADEILLRLHRDSTWQVVIQTVDSLEGGTIEARAKAAAEEAKVKGLLVLISKSDHKIYAQPSESALRIFTSPKTAALIATLKADFLAKEFDKGVVDAAEGARKIALPNGLRVGIMPLADADLPRNPSREPGQTKSAPPPAPTAPGETPPKADPLPAEEPAKSNVALYAIIAVAAIGLLWLLSRAFRRPAVAQSAGGYAMSPPPPTGYAPQPQNMPPQPPPGYGQPPRQPPPGYGQPQGYAPGGYAPAPPAAGGGGFVTGALGGLGGAIVGNMIYDRFGRPQPQGYVEPQHHGQAPIPNDRAEPAPAPTHETYDPNSGAGTSWSEPEPAPAPPADQWAGGGGGSWGEPEQAASGGSEGSWGQPEPDAGAGGSWGSPEPESPPDGGGGGDWGGDAAPEPEQGQEGGW